MEHDPGATATRARRGSIGIPGEALTGASAPSAAELRSLLDRVAPLQPAPLCPEIQVFYARSLVEVWEAAEAVAGEVLPAPFWAYPWAAGAALARWLLDHAADVRGRTVLDFGAGGGVASLAAARAGAARVVANDIDPWAIAVVKLASHAQGLTVDTLLADLGESPANVTAFDVVLCGDLLYEQQEAPRQMALLRHAAAAGALVLAADAGRTYFRPERMEQLSELELNVPRDLEGVDRRTVRLYRVLE